MTVAIRSMEVAREHRQVVQGQTVTIYAKIANVSLTSVLYNPVYTPLITVYAPDGTILVNDVNMINVSVGVWSYTYQTTVDSTLGLYRVSVKAIDIGQVAITEKRQVFKVVATTTLATFTYFAIQDQDAVVWYWYVTNDNVLDIIAGIPSFLGKQATLIVQGTVPSWLEVDNPTPALRYIYPDVTGEPTLSASQPSVGSGRVGSPTVVAISGSSYVISLNVSDEIILTLV